MNSKLALLARGLSAATLLVLSVAAHAELGRVLATGDSITRRTGLCNSTDTYASCNAAGRIPHEDSYAALLPAYSSFDYLVKYNSGRGGDTCTNGFRYANGPFVGLQRGLLARLSSTVISPANTFGADTISVLIGINDVNVMGRADLGEIVSVSTTVQCIQSVWAQLLSSGFKVRAMTYPLISATNSVFPDPADSKTRASQLNAAIRSAYAAYKAQSPTSKLTLVDGELAYTEAEIALMTSDGVHPNAKGAARLARLWVQTP